MMLAVPFPLPYPLRLPHFHFREEGLDLTMIPELEAGENGKAVINLFLIVHALDKVV
jgi:hypothetical protein